MYERTESKDEAIPVLEKLVRIVDKGLARGAGENSRLQYFVQILSSQLHQHEKNKLYGDVSEKLLKVRSQCKQLLEMQLHLLSAMEVADVYCV